MPAKKAKSPAASANAGELLKAARATTPDKLKKLLDAGANVGVRDKQGMTALHAAAGDARLKSVELLLERGADPNAEDEQEDTPLHHALSARANINDRELEDRAAIAQALIEAGGEIEAPGSAGRTALWGACNLARGKATKLVAFVMARKPDLSATDEEDYSILHIATIYNHESVARAAIAAKAGVNAKDNQGGTPLLHAAFHGRSELVKILLAAKADPNIASKDGYTPLRAAALQGYLHIVKTLVEAGAKLEIADKDKQTALEVASFRRHGDIVKYLLDRGAKPRNALHSIPSLRLSDGNVGSTVKSKIVQMLLEAGADPNAKDSKGLTPLQHFFHDDARHWSLDAIAILVKAGADIGVRVKNDKGKPVTVKALLNGAPPALCRDAKGFAKLGAMLGE
jgi:ankyrin repeat protein